MTERTRSRLKRRVQQITHLAASMLASPRYAAVATRKALTRVLDDLYEHDSPLLELNQSYLSSIYRFEVTLPPRRLMLPGNQSLPGLVFLISLARAIDARSIFEVGTYNGLTAWCLGRNLVSSTVHTLDLPTSEAPALPLFEGDPGNRIAFPKHVYDVLPHEGRVIQEWGDSARFDFAPWHGRCDLVYIDGAHSPEYVESDTRNAFKMLSPTGAIVWDDYWWSVPGVGAILDHLQRVQGLDLARIPETRLVTYLSPRAKKVIEGLSTSDGEEPVLDG